MHINKSSWNIASVLLFSCGPRSELLVDNDWENLLDTTDVNQASRNWEAALYDHHGKLYSIQLKTSNAKIQQHFQKGKVIRNIWAVEKIERNVKRKLIWETLNSHSLLAELKHCINSLSHTSSFYNSTVPCTICNRNSYIGSLHLSFFFFPYH